MLSPMSARKPHLVATFITYNHEEGPVIVLHIIVDKNRDAGVQLFAH